MHGDPTTPHGAHERREFRTLCWIDAEWTLVGNDGEGQLRVRLLMLHIGFRRAYHAVLQLVVPPRDGAAGPKLIQGAVIHTEATGRFTRAGQYRAFDNALEELRRRFDAGDPEVTRFFTADGVETGAYCEVGGIPADDDGDSGDG